MRASVPVITDLVTVKAPQLHAMIRHEECPPITCPSDACLRPVVHRTVALAPPHMGTVAVRMLDTQGVDMIDDASPLVPAITAGTHTAVAKCGKDF